jgi:hypothetical protein
MLASGSYNTFESGLNNAKMVVGLEWLYESARRNLSKVTVAFLMAILGLPFVLVTGYWLRTKRRKLQRLMRKNTIHLMQHSDYLAVRESLDKLTVLMPTLKKVARYDLKRTPWPMSYTLRQMQGMTTTLITYSEWLMIKINTFNQQQFKTNSQTFKLVSETEMWEGRNQAYRYWM